MKRPTILFCDDKYIALLHDPWFKSGGATKQVVAWVDGLMARDVDVKVVGAHSSRSVFEKNDHLIRSYDSRKGIPKLRYLYVRIPGMLKAIVRSRADYVYYGIPSAFAGVLAGCSRILKKKFILRVSNDFFVDERARGKFDAFRYFWFWLGFRLADYILCQNDYQLAQLKAKYPQKSFKIGNPYLGEIAAKPRSLGERRHVAWIGIFQHQKNLPLLLEIARRMPEVSFRIAGGNDNPLSQKDQNALAELQSLPNVSMAGFLNREKVLELLDESYLLLNTSHYEGFSNTFLEAFSRGTPVLTLPKNDPDRIIQKHELGAVFSDIETACKRIRQFGREEVAFDRASANTVRYMRQNHDLSRQTREFLRLIEWTEEPAALGRPVEA